MATLNFRHFALAALLTLSTGFAHATSIQTISGDTVVLTSGWEDGVQAGMTALVYGTVEIDGKPIEVEIAKVNVTEVEAKSCKAIVQKRLTTPGTPEVSVGQRAVFQQALAPPPDQSETDAQRQAEMAKKFKDADFFLSRGDSAYGSGDYALAASCYYKVANVDESYRYSGAKYWLSTALAAKTKGDSASRNQAWLKLKTMPIPKSLLADYEIIAVEVKHEEQAKADDLLARGDQAYGRKWYGDAVSYYKKAMEIDETYKGAAAKYWLAKGLVAKSQKNEADRQEVDRQLAGTSLPDSTFESLQLDFASLGFAAARKESANVTLIPMGWNSTWTALERGEEIIFPVSYDVGQFGRPYLKHGKITLSQGGISLPNEQRGKGSHLSVVKVLEVEILPVDPSKGFFSPVQSSKTLKLKVVLGEKNKKRVFRYFNHGAKILKSVRWGGYIGIDIVDCSNCDMSLELLATLIEGIPKKPQPGSALSRALP